MGKEGDDGEEQDLGGNNNHDYDSAGAVINNDKDDEGANLTRTRSRGLLLAAATQASRESRRPMQQPAG